MLQTFMNEQPTTEKLSWYQRNKDKALANQKKLYQANKEARKEYVKEHFKNNIDTYRKYSKKYCTRDKHKRIAYFTRKLKEDPLFACKVKLSRSISNSAKRAHQQLPFKTTYGIKQSDLEKVIGCTVEQFVNYFDSLFQPGMYWSNHGTWHIDHIKPVATANSIEEVERLNHYTNLQPLWARDNIVKGSIFEGVRVRR
jgi:hypothetical protein